MYKKILVPLDGSEFSECILEHVRAVATACQVPEVVLLRVIEPWDPQIYDVPEGWQRDVQKKAQTSAEGYLSKLANNLKQEGVAASTTVVQGKPVDEILNYASKNQVGLIAMSTHGRSGISRFAFGSVADRVIRYSAIPLLIASPAACRTGGSPR
ncbi:MAG: universal stress protein [Dehalococcoidia bacterium]|nr:MAG: universal stress protein [Dehalococcoidia bacterium]